MFAHSSRLERLYARQSEKNWLTASGSYSPRSMEAHVSNGKAVLFHTPQAERISFDSLCRAVEQCIVPIQQFFTEKSVRGIVIEADVDIFFFDGVAEEVEIFHQRGGGGAVKIFHKFAPMLFDITKRIPKQFGDQIQAQFVEIHTAAGSAVLSRSDNCSADR